MNKGFFRSNLIVFAGALLLGAAFLSGCPSPAVNSAVNVNAPANKESAAAEKKAEATPPAASAGQSVTVLRDYRKNDYQPETFSKAETEAVLKYVLGEGAHDVELEITSRVAGSFTKPDAKETLYFITGCKDEAGKFVSNATCGHVAWNTAGWIAVFDGTTPVLKIEEALGGGIDKVTDVNGDRLNEILSSGGYAGMGIVTESGRLGQIANGKYEEIKTFRGSADNCADSISKDKKSMAALVNYAPATGGKMPEFAEEYFQAQCEGDEIGKNPQWKKITKKEFDEFFDSIS